MRGRGNERQWHGLRTRLYKQRKRKKNGANEGEQSEEDRLTKAERERGGRRQNPEGRGEKKRD